MKANLCHWAGCDCITVHYYCEAHEKEAAKRRKEHDMKYFSKAGYAKCQRHFNYNSVEWRRFTMQITKEVGYCQMCGTTHTLQCHHIKPVREYPELAFNRSNIMVLCRTCHEIKTRQEIQTRSRNR